MVGPGAVPAFGDFGCHFYTNRLVRSSVFLTLTDTSTARDGRASSHAATPGAAPSSFTYEIFRSDEVRGN